MLISRNWLQTFFTDALPKAEELEHALTFHAFEIDGVEHVGDDAILDVKVTPNRGHDCLSHVGIAKELSAILNLPLKHDPLADSAPVFPNSGSHISVSIDTPLCHRYIAGYIQGVKVGPSPDWLRARLESIGQQPRNNIVDATNYIMFHLGQPLHAFDVSKIGKTNNGEYVIEIRNALTHESFEALGGKEYTLEPSNLVIGSYDPTNTVPFNKKELPMPTAIGIAGVKGGMPAGITEDTTDIIIESANFDGVSTRKTAQALKLRTDASARFEQVISPELAAYGMRAVADLIMEIAGGRATEFVDVYPAPQQKKTARVSVAKINQVLGITLTGADVASVFQKLKFAYKEEGDMFEVVAPFERLDIEITEDLIEEVGRIVGYDRVPAIALPPLDRAITVNKNFYWSEKIREYLVIQGFSEVFTSVFVEEGERVVQNKVDGVKPYMRTSVSKGLQEALEKNIHNKELLGLRQVKLFEIGTIWKDSNEEVVFELAVEKVKKEKSADDYKAELDAFLKTLPEQPSVYDDLPISTTERYTVYSRYPYIVRDIALWTPADVDTDSILELIRAEAGDLCDKITLFDTFEKEGRVSRAFRLIFQAMDRTLTDDQINAIMDKITAAMNDHDGWQVR